MHFEQSHEGVPETRQSPVQPEDVIAYEQQILRRYGEAHNLEFGDENNPGKDDARFLELIQEHGEDLRVFLQKDMAAHPELKDACDEFIANPGAPVPPALEEKLRPADYREVA
jgi:hypothetical protein